VPKTGEGSGWSEYTLPALRPTRALAEREIGLIMERAVANFLLEYAPAYRRGDITDIVVDEEPVGGGFVNYRVVVAFTHVEGDQI
jgi:hypothetical protein